MFSSPAEGSAAQSLRIVLSALEHNERPPAWALEEVVTALKLYDKAQLESIGEAFGFPWNKHLAARKLEQLAPLLAIRVAHIQYEAEKAGTPIPLESNANCVGVFEIVGRQFNMSAANVKKYRAAWMRHRKSLGLLGPIYAPPSPAESNRRIAAAIAGSLKKTEKE